MSVKVGSQCMNWKKRRKGKGEKGRIRTLVIDEEASLYMTSGSYVESLLDETSYERRLPYGILRIRQ